MYSTVEVRWFARGSIPAGVADWFSEGAIEPAEQSPRIDYYLQLPDNDALGVKLREGRIEIKARQRKYGPVRFHDRAAGLIEGWKKWSFSLGDAPFWGDEIISGSWLPVGKERWLRKYSIMEPGVVMEIPVEDSVSQGCFMELTSVQVHESDWWSICLEAFGSEADLQSNLLAAAEHVFASHAAPRLEIEGSSGYPAFLSRAG